MISSGRWEGGIGVAGSFIDFFRLGGPEGGDGGDATDVSKMFSEAWGADVDESETTKEGASTSARGQHEEDNDDNDDNNDGTAPDSCVRDGMALLSDEGETASASGNFFSMFQEALRAKNDVCDTLLTQHAEMRRELQDSRRAMDLCEEELQKVRGMYWAEVTAKEEKEKVCDELRTEIQSNRDEIVRLSATVAEQSVSYSQRNEEFEALQAKFSAMSSMYNHHCSYENLVPQGISNVAQVTPVRCETRETPGRRESVEEGADDDDDFYSPLVNFASPMLQNPNGPPAATSPSAPDATSLYSSRMMIEKQYRVIKRKEAETERLSRKLNDQKLKTEKLQRELNTLLSANANDPNAASGSDSGTDSGRDASLTSSDPFASDGSEDVFEKLWTGVSSP